MKFLLFLLGGTLWFGAGSARAGNPGAEVVVVYNTHVPESKAIAEYYALKRQVPTNQIFGFDLPTGEDMTRGEYESLLQLPLAKAIKSNRLWHFETEVVPATNREPARSRTKEEWPTGTIRSSRSMGARPVLSAAVGAGVGKSRSTSAARPFANPIS